MKTIKTFAIILTGFVLLFSGCKKSEITEPSPQPPATLNELKASESFSWSTGQTTEIKIKGLPTVIMVKNTLKINLTNGTTLFSRFHQMDQDLNLKLLIPSTEKKLVLVYGTVSYPLDIVNGIVEFSFIPKVQD
jgi:hypothetical protein